MEHLPYGTQWLDEEDIQALVETARSPRITSGPKTKEFEQRLCERTGAKFAVVMNSGTSALHGSYFAAGVRPGDEVITSPMTFAATANAALYLGARPVFTDIHYISGNMNPNLLDKAITNKTRAIVPVDYAGRPADLEPIIELARNYGLPVIEDAAHSLGATYKGKAVGAIADMTILSFHPVKHITTGEGGAVLTDNEHFYRKLLAFRSHGIVKDPAVMTENHGPWYYEMHSLGYNYRMTDLQCALGISQLGKLDSFLDKRRALAREYHQQLSMLRDFIDLPDMSQLSASSWHLFVIKVKKGARERKRLFEALQAERIGVQVHYIPVYWHPFYRHMNYQKGICPVAEALYERAISLPLFPKMTARDLERVVSVLVNFFSGG
ncbi:UDP-4-amino-4,6-dideoxy-N-acetyl-beta-L-altrosamine transaminase [Paenibacillus sp. y28]|uniref:UDP-4-amino-4, 6-dideoxy-N-acetyl-beta-L-altrosamine transaminase n=1 Tax=Paenibacillus sp. y28 TaxID=3129110 RepID=UPI003017515C